MRTRGQTLLELLGLVGVLKDESVDVGRASDLELDVVDLLVLLYAGGCSSVSIFLCAALPWSKIAFSSFTARTSSSFRDRNLLRIKIGRRTLSILAPADLDELLNVGNFGRHLDGYVSTSRCSDREAFSNFLVVRRVDRQAKRGRTGHQGAECEPCCIGLGGVTTCVALHMEQPASMGGDAVAAYNPIPT